MKSNSVWEQEKYSGVNCLEKMTKRIVDALRQTIIGMSFQSTYYDDIFRNQNERTTPKEEIYR